MHLTTTTEVYRLVTGSAANLVVQSSILEADNTTGAVSVVTQAPVVINSATTTTLGAAPASGKSRTVRDSTLTNNHATVSTTVTPQKYDGTNAADLCGTVTLLPGESLTLTKEGEWIHLDSNGGKYTNSTIARPNVGITGTIAETMDRNTCPEVNTAAPTASGTLFLQAIYLKAGDLVSNISFFSATTASGTPTHGLFGLFDASRNLLASSADFTSEAWAANTIKTKAMTTPYKVPTSGLYYIGVMITATTVPTLKGGTAKTGGQLAATAPILHGTSSTGLTTAMPNPAAAITGGLINIWGAVT